MARSEIIVVTLEKYVTETRGCALLPITRIDVYAPAAPRTPILATIVARTWW